MAHSRPLTSRKIGPWLAVLVIAGLCGLLASTVGSTSPGAWFKVTPSALMVEPNVNTVGQIAGNFVRFAALQSTQGTHFQVEFVVGASANAASVALSGESQYSSGPVVAMEAIGSFVGTAAKTPAGAPLPTGSYLYEIANANSGAVEGWGLSNSPVNLSTLGTVQHVDMGVAAAALADNTCTSSQVQISEYNTLVGAGNVNVLFWITNTSQKRCTLHGYVRVAFSGKYGFAPTPIITPQPLDVRSFDRVGRAKVSNDVGGVKSGPIPTVTLLPGHVASFWIYGTDEQVGPSGPGERCITSFDMQTWLPVFSPSLDVKPLANNGFYWCRGVTIHPIVPGESGVKPPQPLANFFGG